MDGTETAARPGRKLTWLGVIAIVLGMMAMIAPGLTGTSVAALVGVFVVWSGFAHLLWAFQAGSLSPTRCSPAACSRWCSPGTSCWTACSRSVRASG